MENYIFDHLDGMYSYIYSAQDNSKVVHLNRFTPVKYVDGAYEVDDEQEN